MPGTLERTLVLLATGLLMGFSLYPVLQEPPQDSFPFSTYPMFAHRKPAVVRVSQVLGRTAGRRLVPLSPQLATGNREVIQAKGMVESAIRHGQTAALCEAAAERVRRTASAATFTELLVATSDFHTTTYFEDPHTPMRRQVHATCALSQAR